MVHRCTHQRTRSLWQVGYPCSGRESEEFGLKNNIKSEQNIEKKMKTKREVGQTREGERENGLPEHQVVSGGMRSHGVPDILVDLRPLIQGLHHPALEQVLVPVALLPQYSCQNLLGARRQLHSHLPQPQREAIMHLEEQMGRPNYFPYSSFLNYYYFDAFYVFI